MTALGYDVATVVFPNPDLSGSIDGGSIVDVSPNIASFSYEQSGEIRSLSTTDASSGLNITGLLYTPVPNDTQCSQWPQYVNINATKVVLPRSGFELGFVALAPWISPNCTLAYLAAVEEEYPIRSFIFYLPGNGSDPPPLANDPAWGLGDGGKWKTSNRFPVYAIPSSSGNLIMSQLALYTGNLTAVPNGHELADEYPASDYVRLAVQIGIAGESNLPSLWVFLLIVLGILILIIGSTSFVMHCVQQRRRESLRRRVASGEIDLEALGIKRLTVPQDILDKMPLYTYTSETGGDSSEAVAPQRPSADADGSAAKETSPEAEARGFTQPTCAICLDDFARAETVVRELPCGHIFHPDCIDAFLRENSSLCPMCKKSVLPRGFCPPVVTNAMVRRERLLRRLRAQSTRDGRDEDDDDDDEDDAATGRRWRRAMTLPGVRRAVASAGRRVFSAPSPTGAMMMRARLSPPESPRAAEAAATPAPDAPALPAAVHAHDMSPAAPPVEVEAAQLAERRRPGRREWARQRALAMVRRISEPPPDAPPLQTPQREGETARPSGWARMVRRGAPSAS